MQRINNIILVIALLGIGIGAEAQDFHLSQYDAAALNVNPAMTGLFSGSYRIHGHYRTQWSAISTKPFVTGLIAADKAWGDVSGGVQIANYSAGAGRYNVFSALVSGAYDFALDANRFHHISLGVQGGIIQKSIKQDQLYFENQYVVTSGGYFNQNLSSGENLANQSIILPDVNAGLLYYYGNDYSRINPFIGFSVFHITQPKESFFSSDNKLPMLWLIHGGTRININEKIQLLAKVFSMHQRNASELTFSLFGNYYLENQDAYLIFGPTFRLSGPMSKSSLYGVEDDAVILELGVKYGKITTRISYDINTSSLKPSTKGRGGFEISLTYIASNRKPNPVKNCPRL